MDRSRLLAAALLAVALAPAALRAQSLDCTAAEPLGCNRLLSGDTAGGASLASAYGTQPTSYAGPERVYRFVNPVRQSVNFLLRNASDPGLDLLLVDACDPTALVDWGDDNLVEPDLAPGVYYVVVDGRSGAQGSFELASICGSASLDPPTLAAGMAPGECLREPKRLFFPTLVPEADLVFSFDLSGSMGQELAQVKANARRIYTELNAFIPSLRFGLASLVEYSACYTDGVCGRSSCPSAPNPFPYRLDQPLTADINQVDLVLQTISLQGGAKETYTYSFWRSYTDPAVGWRDCARRLWLNIADEVPIDCNVYACTGGARNTGRDPGPNLVTGDADDLEILPVVDAMARERIVLMPLDSSENPAQVAMWDCLARRTGGRVFVTDRDGNLPNGSDIVRELVLAIKESLRPCPEVVLVPTGPYASWASVTPASYPGVTTPFLGDFTVTFCVPPGTPPGVYPIDVEARCLGAAACEAELLGVQEVRLSVASLAVQFDSVEAVRRADGSGVEVRFRTLSEEGTLGFRVERSGGPDGPFAAAGELEARGGGSEYRLLDAAAPPAPRPWYRVVETTLAGAGDASLSVEAREERPEAPRPAPARGGRGRRVRRP